MKQFWDKRYASEDYVYGTKPNHFFKEVVDSHDFRGKILLPAEGEGRNAVYAAKNGLEVFAFDTSIEGKNKALKLAKKENVEIIYEVGEFFDLQLVNEEFDVVALIFAHFPPGILSKYHGKIADLIKPNGTLFLEGFSTKHLEYQKLNPEVGGPPKLEMLFSVESIKQDFPNFDIFRLEEIEVKLQEGKCHNGTGKVIRFIGRKKHL